ncbi:MAG: GntR family transcriptional regulator [Clostridiales bacterium]|jgi:DNA-binding transcriptional regulator YhcF (GntR family)|nr:GntR family transcriptional regulator [Clostridiales bacterium]
MKITIDEYLDTPIYQQIVDSITRDVLTGVISEGCRLPTVRDLSEECGVSPGTVKHAFDMLERHGLIEKKQGRGTFVREMKNEAESGNKDEAVKAADCFLDEMQRLGFSMRDTRIFLDLKLREREQMIKNVLIGVVDCSPEPLATMCRQISSMPNVDVYEYLLQPVLESPQRFEPGLDMVVTTPAHFEQLREKMTPDQELMRLVMNLSQKTVMQLARIPSDSRVGILAESDRYSRGIFRTCEQYCILQEPPKIALFHDSAAAAQMLSETDRIVLPANYEEFCSRKLHSALEEFSQRTPLILYQYQIERGSLLYLEEHVYDIRHSVKTQE